MNFRIKGLGSFDRVFLFVPVLLFLGTVTFEVNAVFYLEQRHSLEMDDDLSDVKWQQIESAKHALYECGNQQHKSDDRVKPRFTIQCKQVTDMMLRHRISHEGSFYVVFKPMLTKWAYLHLGGKFVRRGLEFPADLRVGFLPNPNKKGIDFPMFAPYGNQDGLLGLLAVLQPLEALKIPRKDIIELVIYMNTVVIYKVEMACLWTLSTFVKTLRIFKDSLLTFQIQGMQGGLMKAEQWNKLARLFLNKMMDPCALPQEYLRKADETMTAEEMCQTYCDYLMTIKSYFQIKIRWCNKLSSKKANCVRGACTCYTGAWQWVQARMTGCNNSYRKELDRLISTKVPYQQAVLALEQAELLDYD
nr:PREDICTED: uncharacterized protein LOC109031211 [Bemisia tabaci]